VQLVCTRGLLYEYLTGFLPKWPFYQPPQSRQRLRQRMSLSFVAFLKQALAVDPGKRFANAEKMLAAMLEAVPKNLKTGFILKTGNGKKLDWRKMRRGAFLKRYDRVISAAFRCADCGEPIAESMMLCPWCGRKVRQPWQVRPFPEICTKCGWSVDTNFWNYCP
jgi:hypothetical protein